MCVRVELNPAALSGLLKAHDHPDTQGKGEDGGQQHADQVGRPAADAMMAPIVRPTIRRSYTND